jgi:hypothetical protein
MQDIDFDEIDRAVNSASANGAPAIDTAVAPVAPPVAEPTPVVDAPAAAPMSVPPAARRSSGRFMDVVHPSSDMRTTSADRLPVPVQPREDAPAPTAPAPAPEPQANEWPDPLDFHGFNEEPASEAPVETPVAPVVTDAPAARVPAPSAHDMHPPLETPFLRNAVVEKRPLGAFSETPPVEPAAEPIVPEVAPDPVADAPAAPEQIAESAPAPAAFTTPVPSPVVDVPAGPVSITQQYKEQPSTTDQQSGAIFDTESYHQPLTHVPTKKSGALVIIWIAALILVGAGAGAAVYFFVLPLL